MDSSCSQVFWQKSGESLPKKVGTGFREKMMARRDSGISVDPKPESPREEPPVRDDPGGIDVYRQQRKLPTNQQIGMQQTAADEDYRLLIRDLDRKFAAKQRASRRR
jgi:hypothetical protein